MLSSCADDPEKNAAPKAASNTALWPTVEGVPVNQWYMRTQDADGSQIAHYIVEYGVEAKPGNTVIVLHGGWGAEHSYLIPAISQVADTYRFVLYDQRGSLRTPVIPPAKISYSALVEDLEQLRQRLGLDKVTLMAHSMGNHLAYGYLRAHPERVAGLILVGAVPPAPLTDEEPAFLKDVWPEFAKSDAAAIAKRKETWVRDWSDRCLNIAIEEGLIPKDWAVKHPPETNPDLQALYIKKDQDKTAFWRMCYTTVNTFGGKNWREMRGGMVYYTQAAADAVLADPAYETAVNESWPALKAFGGPVRVIIGTHDYVDMGPVFWPKLVSKMPNARLDVIQNAGHSAWMDEPGEFTQTLRSALKATTKSR
jgi:pimeloyl-ACP methyl ester carboxylesterase